MKDRIAQWQERFEAFSLRERGMIYAAIVTLVFMVWDTTMLSPQEVKQKQTISKMRDFNQQLENISTQVSAMTHKLRAGDARHIKVRIEELRDLLSGLERKQQDLTVEFIRPEQMATVLRDMLGNETKLSLTRLESLSVEPLFPEPIAPETGTLESEAYQADSIQENTLLIKIPLPGNEKTHRERATKNSQATGSNIYKHGMRVVLEGDFISTLNYLQALESMPWRFYWDNVEYQVLEYPLARVVITVHTLSLNKGWIGV